MLFKKILFIGVLLGILILNIGFILGVNYKIDLNNDGLAEKVTGDRSPPFSLNWQIAFKTYGGNNGANLPTLSITGDDSFSVSVPDIEYTGSGFYHAFWGWSSDRCEPSSCSMITKRWYTFQHYPNNPWVWTEYRTLDVGTYNLNMVSYGDGLNPSQIEPSDSWWANWEGKSCPVPITNSVACRNPPCPSPGYYEYIESVFSPYCDNLGIPTICPVCNDDPKTCTEYDSNNGYLCNGVTYYIEFFDNNGIYVWGAYLNTSWIQGSFSSYIKGGLNYTTDSTPQAININQIIKISEGCSDATECPINNKCYEPDCILNECAETLVATGGTDEACVGSKGCTLGSGISCRCDGAGGCVECNSKPNCPADTWTSNYRCNPTNPQQIQRQSLNYTCSSNTCVPSNPWYNFGGICTAPDVCVGGRSTCCTPYCGPGDSYQCGDNGCGGTCGPLAGECPPATPTCVDHMCYSSGNAYWANMNGDKIGEGSSRIHSEIDDTVLLIYKDHGSDVGLYNFVIYEDDTLSSDDIVRTIPTSQTFNYKGHLAAKWIINLSDFYKESDLGKAEFYFEISTEQSNKLYVNDSSTTPPDAPAVVIKEPVIDSRVRVGSVINFNQTAKDPDDDLRIRWTFEDGDNSAWMYNCLTTGNCNTTHAYDSSGTKVIEIIAREMTRTQEAVNYSQVFAYAPGINVFAVINSPPFGNIFTGTGTIPVPFNANKTYIANCTIVACTPGQTCYNVEDLFCYDLSKTGALGIPLAYDLFFDWIFSEGAGRYGDWSDDHDYIVEFSKLFIAPTAHWAKLGVTYNPV